MACCCRCAGVNFDTSTIHSLILRPPFLVDSGGMVFDRSAKVRPGIEEACDYGIVFCEDLDGY